MNLDQSRSRKSHAALLLALSLLLLAILPYWQTRHFGFVDFDDQGYVRDNPYVQQGLNVATVRWAFTTFETGNWHPLTWLSHMLDVEWWGKNVGAYHLTNALFHAGNTILLFLALFQATGRLWRAALVGALFAIHPLHVESVAWISERKDVLSSFFGFLALWAYVGYAKSGSVKKYLAAVAAFALSLLAKQMWVTFPFLLLLLDLWPLQRWRLWRIADETAVSTGGRPFGRIILEKIPFFLLTVGFSIIALIAQRDGKNMASLEFFPLASRFANAAVGYVAYLGKLIVPVRLAYYYPHPIHWQVSAVVMCAVILLLMTAAAVAYRRRFPWLLIGWLWFVGTLVPVIGVVQIGSQTIADRYSYLPSVGIFLCAVWSIPFAARSRPFLNVAVALLLVGLTIRTWRQVGYWKDSETLFSHAAQVTRANYMAHQSLGNLREKDGDLMSALALYRTVVAERPPYAKVNAHENIANVLIRQQRYAEAERELHAALELNPKSSFAYSGLGSLFMLTGDNEKAATFYQRSLELDSENKGARLNYGLVLVNLGRWDEAIELLGPLTRAEPERLFARTRYAIALAGRGDSDRALEELRQILQRDPEFAAAKDALSTIEIPKATPSPAP